MRLSLSLAVLVVSFFLLNQASSEEKPLTLSREECVSTLSPEAMNRKTASSSDVMAALSKAKTVGGEIVFEEMSADFIESLSKYFDTDPKITSRLEQFYALLFLIAREWGAKSSEALELDRSSAQNILRASRVFPDDALISSLESIETNWNQRTQRAHWDVKLSTDELRLPMNSGLGYLAFQHGICQKVHSLILYGGFKANIELNRDNNIFVRFEEPVDFYGAFGSRGVVDVDVTYVSLFDVEFHHGSRQGTSRVKIARREFEIKRHSWFLRFVSRMVSEKTTQPIDW
jgi:hypothetical protein